MAIYFDPVAALEKQTALGIAHLIAEKIAERYVAEHFAEIAAQLDQNAIANLAVAEASKKIAQEIERSPKPRPVVSEVHNHFVKRSIF